MDWVFFPANFLFNMVPVIFMVVGAVLGLSLSLYTWQTAVDLSVMRRFTATRPVTSKALLKKVLDNKTRLKKNVAMVIVFLYVMGGAFSGSLPKNKIPTRDGSVGNANTAYLAELDRKESVRSVQPQRVPPAPFEDFEGWHEEEYKQNDRIKAALP